MRKIVFILSLLFLFAGCKSKNETIVLPLQSIETNKKTTNETSEKISLTSQTENVSQKLDGVVQKTNLDKLIKTSAKEEDKKINQPLSTASQIKLSPIEKTGNKISAKTLKKEKKKKKQVYQVQAKPSSFYYIEKTKEGFVLWIQNLFKSESAALVITYDLNDVPNKYFLRSLSKLKNQKDNELSYEGKKIGQSQNLFFLAVSHTEKNLLLGESFKIILPKEAVYGYNGHSQKIKLIPEITRFDIRFFEKKYGQGKYQDKPVLFTLKNKN